MKKAIVALLLVMCVATLFAATVRTQTIILISVVEEVRPNFNLEVLNVKNGYYINSDSKETAIHSCNVKEDVSATLGIYQSMSRFAGSAKIEVSATELSCGRFSTEGLKISGLVNECLGRSGNYVVSENTVVFNLEYNGKQVADSLAAEIFVEYNGDSNLPDGEYISFIRMVCEVE